MKALWVLFISGISFFTSFEDFRVPESDYVIFEYQHDMDYIFKDAKATNLTLNELAKIETIIKQATNDYTKSSDDVKIDLSIYKRQYVPIINANGEKEVWVNLFCDDWFSNEWKNKIFIVELGGDCYLNLKVNLDKEFYYNLSVNDDRVVNVRDEKIANNEMLSKN